MMVENGLFKRFDNRLDRGVLKFCKKTIVPTSQILKS